VIVHQSNVGGEPRADIGEQCPSTDLPFASGNSRCDWGSGNGRGMIADANIPLGAI